MVSVISFQDEDVGSILIFDTNTVIKRSGIRRGLNSLSWVEKRNTSLPVTKPRCVIFLRGVFDKRCRFESYYYSK